MDGNVKEALNFVLVVKMTQQTIYYFGGSFVEGIDDYPRVYALPKRWYALKQTLYALYFSGLDTVNETGVEVFSKFAVRIERGLAQRRGSKRRLEKAFNLSDAKFPMLRCIIYH
jgi:hypothetical protein